MIQKVKIKGYRHKAYRPVREGELYFGCDLKNMGVFKWTNNEPSLIQAHILEKIEKNPKWIEATPENIRELGYPWGEPVPCRAKDDGCKWVRVKLVDMSNIGGFWCESDKAFEVIRPEGGSYRATKNEYYKHCQIRNKPYKGA